MEVRVAGQCAVAARQCATGLRLRGATQRPGWAAAAVTGAGCAVTAGNCRHNEITEHGSISLAASRAAVAGRPSGEALQASGAQLPPESNCLRAHAKRLPAQMCRSLAAAWVLSAPLPPAV